MDGPSTSAQAAAWAEERAALDWESDSNSEDENEVENIPPEADLAQKSKPSTSTSISTEAPRLCSTRSRLTNKEIYDGELVDNSYPRKCFRNVARKDLVVDFDDAQQQLIVRFSPTIDDVCIICHQTADRENSVEMITCQGYGKGKECKSKFHYSCITRYNSDGFHFQFSALPENQNKLLCPLHFCAHCSVSHYKQSAYHGELTECALCIRAFHSEGCLPAGYVDIAHKLDRKFANSKFMICPAHVDYGRHFLETGRQKSNKKHPTVHMKVCMYCDNEGYQHCSACLHSFHKQCVTLEEIDETPFDGDKCPHCLTQETIKFEQPVLARWRTALWIAVTKPWSFIPAGHRLEKDPNYLIPGYTVLHWVLEKGLSLGIHPITDIALMERHYLQLACNDEVRNMWTRKMLKYQDKRPSLCRKVLDEGETLKYLTEKKLKVIEEEGICECRGPIRCVDENCKFILHGAECPEACSKVKGGCQNRNVSVKTTNPNIELRRTDAKGYGVFATKAIAKDTYIAEYIGEVIDKKERERRITLAKYSLDFQAAYYMMNLSSGLTVDAARYGNISRYINHSCDPNCKAYIKDVFTKKSKSKHMYETRAFIKANRDIKNGEELTFDYGHSNQSSSISKCHCNSANCTGKLWATNNGEDDEDLDDSHVALEMSADLGRERSPSPVPTKVQPRYMVKRPEKKSAKTAKPRRSVPAAPRPASDSPAVPRKTRIRFDETVTLGSHMTAEDEVGILSDSFLNSSSQNDETDESQPGTSSRTPNRRLSIQRTSIVHFLPSVASPTPELRRSIVPKSDRMTRKSSRAIQVPATLESIVIRPGPEYLNTPAEEGVFVPLYRPDSPSWPYAYNKSYYEKEIQQQFSKREATEDDDDVPEGQEPKKSRLDEIADVQEEPEAGDAQEDPEEQEEEEELPIASRRPRRSNQKPS